MIHFDTERLPTKDVYIAPETYRRRYELMHERFSKMLEYALNTESCRGVVIENYFGDNEAQACGVCDICLSKRRRTRHSEDIELQIIEQLRLAPYSVKDLVSAVGGNADVVVETIEKMVRGSKIYLAEGGKLKINM